MARPSAPPSTPDPAAARKRLLGRRGEDLAATHLVRAGMLLVDRNWRCAAGEIDLVLRDGPVLVVCEVKTRTSMAYGAPLEGVTRAKADRLRRLAALWLRAHDLHVDGVRIDLVGILAPPGGPVEVEHVAGVC